MSKPVRTPIGVVRAGAIATVDDRAVIRRPDTEVTTRLWVSGVDRWRVTESEPTLRRRTVGDAPVVEWSVRVPGGDVSWSTFGFVPAGGSDAPAVALSAHNESTEPVAVALVVGPVGTAEVRSDALVVDGRVAARFARSPRGLVRAATLDALVERLAELSGPDTSGVVDGSAGGQGEWVAAVAPVAHTAKFEIVVGDGDAWGATFPIPPEATQVATGWATHAERGLQLRPADDAVAAAWRRATTTLALHGTHVDAAAVPAVGAAVARLGWREDAVELAHRAIGAQTGSGAVGETVDDTIDAVDLWASTIGLDLTEEGNAAMVLPLAGAAGWLGRGRTRRSMSPEQAARAANALSRAAAAMRRAGEDLAGDDLRRAAASLDPTGAGAGEAAASAPSATGVTVELDGCADPIALARWVVAQVDAHVRCTTDGVDVLAGWRPDTAGAPVEVHDADTPWGRVGYAVRWHGRRPALLWEVADAIGPVTWRCTTIDPGWSTEEPSGEALLAEPAGLGDLDLVEATVEMLGSPQPSDGPAEGESFA